MKLTDQEAHDRLIAATSDDGTIEDQWGTLDTGTGQWSGLWGHYQQYDQYDTEGDLRYYSTLIVASEIMMGVAATAVQQSDGAGGSLAAEQWFDHLKAIHDEALLAKAARLASIQAAVGLLIAEINTYTLTPVFAGSRLPQPGSPYYAGDPRYHSPRWPYSW